MDGDCNVHGDGDGNRDGDDGKMCLVVSRLPQDKEGKRLVLRRYCTVYYIAGQNKKVKIHSSANNQCKEEARYLRD